MGYKAIFISVIAHPRLYNKINCGTLKTMGALQGQLN